MDWDDIRVFLAVARAGSLSGGAKILGVNHSTVFRRIEAFENRLNVRLFDRHRSGYALTPEGDEMLRTAERIDEEVLSLDRSISGRDIAMQGVVRVTTADTIAQTLLGPILNGFVTAYPGIDVELYVDQQFFNLTRREADIALRPTVTPPENLVGRKLSPIAFAAYASPKLISGALDMSELQGVPWIIPDDSLAHIRAFDWFRTHMKQPKVVMRCNSFSAMQGAIEAGMGAALLPCFWGDSLDGIDRISAILDGAGSDLWILTHQDLRYTARIKAFMDFVGRAVKAEGHRLTGAAA